jgi:hypothetical protein
MSLKPETVWRRMVEDTRIPAKHRLAALERMLRPSLSLLRRLLAAKSTPAKLRLLAAQKYDLAISRKELLKDAKRQIQA